MGRAPLGEQVGDLKLPDAAPLRHIDPPRQPLKAELPAAGELFHLHQLGGGPLAAYLGVQRRGEDGGQEKVNAVVRSSLHEFLNPAPVGLAENLQIVVGGDAVRMEPLGKQQLLLRQLHADQLQGKLRYLPDALLLVGEGDPHRIDPGLRAGLGLDGDPDRVEAVRDAFHHGFLHGVERIREEAGIRPQIVVIPVGIGGELRGDVAHLPEGNGVRQGGIHLQGEIRLAEAVQGVGDLVGIFLTAQQAAAFEGIAVDAVQEYLCQRGQGIQGEMTFHIERAPFNRRASWREGALRRKSRFLRAGWGNWA